MEMKFLKNQSLSCIVFLLKTFADLKVTKAAVARRIFLKKEFLKILQNSQENACARVSFLIKLQDESATLSKRDSDTDVFL